MSLRVTSEFKAGRMWLRPGKPNHTWPIPISGPVILLHFFLQKLQSLIMRSYVKCCKIQVPPSWLSELLWILLHIVMQLWGFAGLCFLDDCLRCEILPEECSFRGPTRPLLDGLMWISSFNFFPPGLDNTVRNNFLALFLTFGKHSINSPKVSVVGTFDILDEKAASSICFFNFNSEMKKHSSFLVEDKDIWREIAVWNWKLHGPYF